MKEFLNGLKTEPLNRDRVQKDFFRQSDVVFLAKQLLGFKLVSFINNKTSAGIITETEAYAGITDRASHAYGGLRTNRTVTMYLDGGMAYIYLCYGIHSLFNIVTNLQDIPHAVLIRGIYPVDGLEVMQERVNRKINLNKDGSGPGKVTRLLGLDRSLNGEDLSVSDSIWLERSGFNFPHALIRTTARIGVGYAGDDALLPYRFVVDPKNAGLELKKAGLIETSLL